jgi:CheY-like chemotaxis protein
VTTILLVEDDAMNRDMLYRRLVWEGFRVVIAQNGSQAIEMAVQEQPQLVLMDMGLPVVNGWQATRELKRMEATRHIPVIALTAYASPEDREACLRAGCDDFETKPVEFQRLKAKISALLQLQGGESLPDVPK